MIGQQYEKNSIYTECFTVSVSTVEVNMTTPKPKNDNVLFTEQIKKPGMLNQLIPWVITIFIFIWLYSTIDFRQIFKILGQAQLSYFIPFMVGFVILLGVIDSFTFGQAYSWFCTHLTAYERLEVRIAPYIFQVIFAQLADVFVLLYLWRKKGVHPTHALSSTIWTMVNDYAAFATMITIAVIYNIKYKLIPQINIYWLMAVIIFWLLYFLNLIFWHSSLQPRIAARIERSHKEKLGKRESDNLLLRMMGEIIQLLRTFSMARWYHYLFVYGLRILALTGVLVSNCVALKSLGINISVSLALVAIPIINLSYFLPINIAGFGGPQAISILFLYEIGHCGSKEQIVAYSLLWSTSFLICRFFFGLVFIRGFWGNAFPEGFTRWLKRSSA